MMGLLSILCVENTTQEKEMQKRLRKITVHLLDKIVPNLKTSCQETGHFDWKRLCFMQAKNIGEEFERSSDNRTVETLEIKDTILSACQKRNDA